MAERRQADLAAVSLGEAFAQYLCARSELRPKTVKDYQRVMSVSFGDWRKRPLVEITGDMVGKRHTLLGKDHGKACERFARENQARVRDKRLTGLSSTNALPPTS